MYAYNYLIVISLHNIYVVCHLTKWVVSPIYIKWHSSLHVVSLVVIIFSSLDSNQGGVSKGNDDGDSPPFTPVLGA